MQTHTNRSIISAIIETLGQALEPEYTEQYGRDQRVRERQQPHEVRDLAREYQF